MNVKSIISCILAPPLALSWCHLSESEMSEGLSCLVLTKIKMKSDATYLIFSISSHLISSHLIISYLIGLDEEHLFTNKTDHCNSANSHNAWNLRQCPNQEEYKLVIRMFCIDTEALVFMFNGGSLYGFSIHCATMFHTVAVHRG